MTDKSNNYSRRYSGILTQNDREFLQAVEWDEQSSLDRDTRHRIRQRIKEGMRDLHILSILLSEKDRKIVFESAISDPDLIGGALAFYYLGTQDLVDPQSENDGAELFADIIEQSIEIAYQQQGRLGQAEVSVETVPEEPDIDELREKLLASEGNAAQLNYLIRHDKVIPLLEEVSESTEVIEVETPTVPYELTPNEAEQILKSKRDQEDLTNNS